MLRTIRATLTAFALTALPAATAFAQPAPAAPPGTPKPAGTDFPKAAQKLVMPSGYEKVSEAGHTVLCEPNDVKWVAEALKKVTAPAKVPNSPQDMIASLAAKRATLAKQVATDLGIPEKAVTDMLDAELAPTLTKLAELKPPLFYLVITTEKLRDLTKTGWGEPRYHYNRVADSAVFDDNISFSIDKEMDDTVLPGFYDAKTPVADRQANLTALVQSMDTNILKGAAQQVNGVVFKQLLEFIDKQTKALNLKADQVWLGKGMANYLSAKYIAMLTDASKDDLVKGLIQEPQVFPVSAGSIDLLKPTDPANIKEGLKEAYAIAMQRKATWAVWRWTTTAGNDAVIPNTIKAMQAKAPANGADLVKLILDTTQQDVTKFLVPVQ